MNPIGLRRTRPSSATWAFTSRGFDALGCRESANPRASEPGGIAYHHISAGLGRGAADAGGRWPAAVQLTPGADLAATTAQVREVVERLIAADQWAEGDPEILIVLDAGYDAPRIAHILSGLPVQVLGRLRSDRVMRRPTPPRVYDPKDGRPPKHGGEFVFGDPGARSGPSRSPTPVSRQGHLRRPWEKPAPLHKL
ncbi:transposase, partial [Streptomyces indiaensis]|nr:transposase [Streptomyces indiaensis]